MQFRPFACAATAAAALLCGALSSRADIVFHDGAGAVQPDENVLLPTGQSGTTINGTTNQTNTPVIFTQPTSPETLTTPANGQARIASADQVGYTSLRTELASGFSFTEFEANPVFTSADLSFTVGVVEPNGDVNSHVFISGSGNSFFNLQAINGQSMKYVDITGPTNSIRDVRQIRIGGIAATAVPLPLAGWGGLALLGGLGITKGLRSRRDAEGL